MSSGTQHFLHLIRHPFKSRMFFFGRLPSAYFSGVRVLEANEITCKVVVPYKWFSRNPFRSTYFACLSMAAEMSTGILAMMHTFERSPSVSLLVTRMESVYFKKATEITVFTCNGGLEIKASIDAAIHSGIAQTCVVKSTGLNPNGETVAEFVITWSFKARQK